MVDDIPHAYAGGVAHVGRDIVASRSAGVDANIRPSLWSFIPNDVACKEP
jgi:hypothetical protein